MEPDRKQLAQLLPLLPVLAELGRTEHVTETAELLGVPQSTVSRALARASAAVGTELLVRDGRGVRLTPAARTLLPYIEQALAEFQAGLDLVRNESEVVRGTVSVSFQHTFGEATLPLLMHHQGGFWHIDQLTGKETALAPTPKQEKLSRIPAHTRFASDPYPEHWIVRSGAAHSPAAA